MEGHDPRRPQSRGPHPLAPRREEQAQHEQMAVAAIAAQTTRDHAIADACSAFTVLVDVAAEFLRSHVKTRVQIDKCGIEGRREHLRKDAEPTCSFPRGHIGPHSWEPFVSPDYHPCLNPSHLGPSHDCETCKALAGL